MQELIISPYLLAVFFFLVAFLYSSIGMAGGSSYTALLAIFGASQIAIPSISLLLNLLVSTLGSFNFIRKRHARLHLILPFLVTSIPFSYLGGSLHLPKALFLWILLISLVIVVLRIYVWKNTTVKLALSKQGKLLLSLFIGAVLGFVAGTVGIGGGIYLAPLILILGLGTVKEAAASAAIFIWVNSLSGLVARFQADLVDYDRALPLIVAVILGGLLGSYLGAGKFKTSTMEKILGIVIIMAIFFLLKNLIQL